MDGTKNKLERYIGSIISAVLAVLLICVFGLFYFFIFKEIPGVGYIGYIFIGIALVAVKLKGEKKMILVNTDFITGKDIETIQIVKGAVIQSKHLGKDIMASFKTIVGGELKGYSDMMNEARAKATKRMVEEAEALGADGVINIRYASAAVMQGAAEVMAYGTAVKFK